MAERPKAPGSKSGGRGNPLLRGFKSHSLRHIAAGIPPAAMTTRWIMLRGTRVMLGDEARRYVAVVDQLRRLVH